jgi:U3 small nucleolar RNA-associated protein 10
MLFTLLPYHNMPLFATVLPILPQELPATFRWLQPYIESLALPPRQALVNTAVRDTGFITAWSSYVLKASRRDYQNQPLTSYWATISCDAVIGQLDQITVGRKEARRQKEDDVLLRLMPIMNEALSMRKSSNLRVGCYMILTVLASRIELQDKVLRAMMEAVVGSRTEDTTHAEIICLAVLAQRMGSIVLPRKVCKALLSVPTLIDDLVTLSGQDETGNHPRYEVGNLCLGLVTGLLGSMKDDDEFNKVDFVARMIEKKLLVGLYLRTTIVEIAQAAIGDGALNIDTRGRLGDMIIRLAESQETSSVVRKALEESQIDVQGLEEKLQKVILPAQNTAQLTEDVEMEGIETTTPQATYESLKANLPTKTAHEVSFLSPAESHLFGKLYEAFTLASRSKDLLQDFSRLPVLQKSTASIEPLFLSFYIRVWCSPYQSRIRVAALESVRQFLQEAPHTSDFQALIPYILHGLSDSSSAVRRASSDLIVALRAMYGAGTSSASRQVLGREDILGDNDRTKGLKWLDLKDIVSLLDHVLVPSLEECRFDSQQLARVLQQALSGSHDHHKSPKATQKDLKASAKEAILSFLTSHVNYTTSFAVKERLLTQLANVGKVGKHSKSKELAPLLQEMMSADDETIRSACSRDGIDLTSYCSRVVSTISASDREGIKNLLRMIANNDLSAPLSVRQAAVMHLKAVWLELKHNQTQSVETLLALANSSDKLAEDALETVRQLSLSTETIRSLLISLPSLEPDDREVSATPKRRRTSNGHVQGHASEVTEASVQHGLRLTTAVLELVENAEGGKDATLLGPLFSKLADIQGVKHSLHTDLGYLQTVVLSCLNEAAKAAQFARAKTDRTAVRADLVVDLFRITSNTQVQQASLLLMSNLATLVPELIVHSVMPIFTFMGSNLLKQSDDYTAHVIDTTIESVIPPLISAFQKDKRGPLAGVSELLLSFVAAFDHIPVHRRLSLFSALVDRIGAEDFLYALLVVLVDRFGTSEAPSKFAIDLFVRYGALTQLRSFDKYLEVVSEVLQPKPGPTSQYLISKSDDRDVHTLAASLLRLGANLLRAPRTVSATRKMISADEDAAKQVRALYASIKERTVRLSESNRSTKKLQPACEALLNSVTSLLSLEEAIRSLGHLLTDGDDMVKRRILKSLDERIRSVKSGSHATQQACIAFIPQLQGLLDSAEDVPLRQSAIACLDRIAEKFGKTNLPQMESIARTVASDRGLGSTQMPLRVMSLICMTTLVEVLVDGIVPIIPRALPLALSHLDETIQQDHVDEGLYNAAFSFVGSLVLYLPWMMTSDYLDRFIQVSESSTDVELSLRCDESRINTLDLVAKQVGARECFSALHRTWNSAVAFGPAAVDEHLNIFGLAVERHSKSIIVKEAQLLTGFCLDVMALRSRVSSGELQNFDDDELKEVEETVGGILIKIIYKLNDTHFRPIFIKMLDWANDSSSKAVKKGRTGRQTSMFAFLHTFFETLKSIVTSYANFIVEPTIGALTTSAPGDDKTSLLWFRAMSTLQSAFEHDQDGKDPTNPPVSYANFCRLLAVYKSLRSNVRATARTIPEAQRRGVDLCPCCHHNILCFGS